MMKKIIIVFVLFVALTMTFSWARISVDEADSLLDMLVSNKNFEEDMEEYDYRNRWYMILDRVLAEWNKNENIPVVMDRISYRMDVLGVFDHVFFEEFEKYINAVRRVFGLDELIYDDELNKLAWEYARYMYENDHFSHNAMDGTDLEYRIGTVDYDYIVVWENLARWYTTITGVIKWWMDSPLHRANVLLDEYENMWLWVKGTYWVNLFGRKR